MRRPRRRSCSRSEDWACPNFKTGVESGAVVEGFDVIEDGGASLGVGGEALMIDQFVFEGAKEGFDEGVIVAVAFAAHGWDKTMLGQTCRQTEVTIDA